MLPCTLPCCNRAPADFAPQLVFYGPGEMLPTGTPGDPALEYDRRKRPACGAFTSGEGPPHVCRPCSVTSSPRRSLLRSLRAHTALAGWAQPYASCPAVPGGVPDSDTARSCCRHFAFAVPRSTYAFAAIDRATTIVASPRLALADAQTAHGVLW